MKINHARFSVPRHPSCTALAAGGLVCILLSGCVAQHALPPPQIALRPVVSARPVSLPAPSPSTPADWRDRPLTAGDWSYRTLASGSVARFNDGAGNGLVAIACSVGQRVVTVMRSAPNPTSGPHAAVPLTVITTARPHPFNAVVPADSAQFGPSLAIILNAGDSTLDDLAFSRGRFAIEASGQPTLVLPAWEEVGRVVEDCR